MSREIVMIIIGMAVVTYLPRWIPLLFLTRHHLSPWLVEWLNFVPAAILSALVFPSILTGGDVRHLTYDKPDLWAAIPTLIFALKTKSLAGTVLVGMACFWFASRLVAR